MNEIEQIPELQNQIKYLQTLVAQLTQGSNCSESVSEVVNKQDPPDAVGSVYRYINEAGDVLYIGADRSYHQNRIQQHTRKAAALRSHFSKIDLYLASHPDTKSETIFLGTPYQATLEEKRLISEVQPRFNQTHTTPVSKCEVCGRSFIYQAAFAKHQVECVKPEPVHPKRPKKEIKRDGPKRQYIKRVQKPTHKEPHQGHEIAE